MAKKARQLDRNSIVRRVDDVMISELDDELVMMRLESNGYFGLDEIGRRIWELLAEPRPVHDLCAQLRQEYDVDEAACEHDVLRYLQELDEHDLLRE